MTLDQCGFKMCFKNILFGEGEWEVSAVFVRKLLDLHEKKIFLSSTYAELKDRGILRPIVFEDDIDFRVLSPDYFAHVTLGNGILIMTLS